MRIHLVAFLILISCFNVFSKARAQKITLQVEQVNLETVFKAIEKQSTYSFAYDVSHLANSKPVSVHLKNVSVKEALDEIFINLPYQYEIINKTIIIKVKTSVRKIEESSKAIIVKGKVTNKQNIPLSGVTVRIKGTNIGTVTDAQGNYTIDAELSDVITFTFVGYRTFEIKVNGQNRIDMTMVESIAELNTTEIKGYYNTTKKFNTGNVTTVTAEQIERQPIGDPIVALQGLVPGLLVRQTSGVAGRKISTRIRGANSLANGNDPLFIVDGVQYTSDEFNSSGNQFTIGGVASPFSYLNAADIETITVLKDADATAIYGSRGANGVVIITTKKAQLGKPKLNLNVYTGFGKADQRLSFMNTNEYLDMRRQALKNDNTTVGVYDYDLNGTWDSTKYTNWQDYFIGGTSQITESNLSYSGGTTQLNFRIGGTYRQEGTIFPGDYKNQKAAFNFGMNHASANNKLTLSLRGSFVANANKLPAAGIENRLALAPNAPDIFNPDGTLNWANSTWENPMSPFLTIATENSKNIISNLVTGYKIFKTLEFKSSFSYNYINFSQVNRTPSIAFDPTSPIPIANRRIRREIQSGLNTWGIEPQLNYSNQLFGGKLEILVGTTFQSTERQYNAISGTGYSSDKLLNTLAAASVISGRVSTPTTYKYSALYTRLGYSYGERYVLNFTARRDGSSRFGPGRKFGNFGALGLAWVFSEETLLENKLPFLSFGKLRFSYGVTGNDQIGEYKYLDTYTSSPIFYQGVSPLIPKQVTNPNYGWERVDKMELGLELGFLDNKFTLNTSLYRNRTKNQLVDYGISSVTGFSSVKANIPAVIQNTGIEIDLMSKNLQGKNFEWSTSINFTVPKNKLISYENLNASSYSSRYIVGQPINSLQSFFTYLGKDETTGQYKFQDYNSDGAYTTTQDQKLRFIGQKYYGGLTNHFSYRMFEVDVLIQFTKQNGLAYYMNTQPGLMNLGYGNELSNDKVSSIRPPFTQSNSLIFENTSLFLASDGQITDASYVRLKNLSLTYNFRLSRAKISGALYVLGQNLITVSKYLGFDPEMPYNAIVLPNLKTIAFGIRLSI